jgi:four helix bundle protein
MHKITFENAPSYQLAEKLSDRIWIEISEWESFSKESIGKELIESVDNIGAKIAAAYAQSAEKDQFFYLRLANSALFETRHWLRTSYKRQLISATSAQTLKQILDELTQSLAQGLTQLKRAA